jgi:hypothetical protein
VVHGDRIDPGKSGFGSAFGRTHELRETAASGALGRREHTTDRPERPVKGELADRRMPAERLGRHLPRSGEHGERDREVEARALLSQLRRRQVDGDPVSRPLQLGRRDPTANPVLRLLAGTICKPDDRERMQAVLEMRFYIDAARVEADQRVGDRPCEHVVTLDNESARVPNGSVQKL